MILTVRSSHFSCLLGGGVCCWLVILRLLLLLPFGDVQLLVVELVKLVLALVFRFDGESEPPLVDGRDCSSNK